MFDQPRTFLPCRTQPRNPPSRTQRKVKAVNEQIDCSNYVGPLIQIRSQLIPFALIGTVCVWCKVDQVFIEAHTKRSHPPAQTNKSDKSAKQGILRRKQTNRPTNENSRSNGVADDPISFLWQLFPKKDGNFSTAYAICVCVWFEHLAWAMILFTFIEMLP